MYQAKGGGRPCIVTICFCFVSKFVSIDETKYSGQCRKTLLISTVEDITMPMYCTYNIIHCLFIDYIMGKLLRCIDFITVICYTRNGLYKCSDVVAMPPKAYVLPREVRRRKIQGFLLHHLVINQ